MKHPIKLVCIVVAVSALAGLTVYGVITATYRLADAVSLPPSLRNFVPLADIVVFWLIASRFTKYLRRRVAHTSGSPSSDADEKRRQAWLQVRAKGKNRYIWRIGVMGWGLSTFAIFTAITLILGPGTHRLSTTEIVLTAVFNLIVWTGGGYFFGLQMWKTFDNKYR